MSQIGSAATRVSAVSSLTAVIRLTVAEAVRRRPSILLRWEDFCGSEHSPVYLIAFPGTQIERFMAL